MNTLRNCHCCGGSFYGDELDAFDCCADCSAGTAPASDSGLFDSMVDEDEDDSE